MLHAETCARGGKQKKFCLERNQQSGKVVLIYKYLLRRFEHQLNSVSRNKMLKIKIFHSLKSAYTVCIFDEFSKKNGMRIMINYIIMKM